MTRLFLILVIVTQLGCASVFWETLGGTVIGSVTAELVKNELEKYEKDESPQP